jgi:hypothetical protein
LYGQYDTKKREPCRIDGTARPIVHWLNRRWPIPHYFFDIKDGHRLVDPSGSQSENDKAAIERAKVLAIGVSLDKPAVDPMPRISIQTADMVEISTVPIYSKPVYRRFRRSKAQPHETWNRDTRSVLVTSRGRTQSTASAALSRRRLAR